MKITNKNSMPEIYAEAIRRKFSKTVFEIEREGESIGVTTLIDSAYKRKLTKLHAQDLEMDVMDAFFSFRGQTFHKVLEDVRMANAIKELYLTVPMNGVRLSGVLDLVLPYRIDDHKTKSVNAYFYYKEYDKLQDERQLNAYRWMLKATYGMEINELFVNRWYFDWVARKAAHDSSYPPEPSKLYPVKLWTMEETKSYLDERVALHLMDTPLPCSSDERWDKPDTWALMKNGNKKATKVYKFEAEVPSEAPTGYSIVFRKGESTRCMDYCNVCQWCEYYQTLNKTVDTEDVA